MFIFYHADLHNRHSKWHLKKVRPMSTRLSRTSLNVLHENLRWVKNSAELALHRQDVLEGTLMRLCDLKLSLQLAHFFLEETDGVG